MGLLISQHALLHQDAGTQCTLSLSLACFYLGNTTGCILSRAAQALFSSLLLPAAALHAEMASLLSVQEENRILQQELSRVEDLLAQSRAERDELAIKYNAISERVGGGSSVSIWAPWP